jgi:glycosyltransferase involved in cell wall biosynthesis
LGGIKIVEISVIMPCYNEAEQIKKNITNTVNTLENNINCSFELIVIDDGSSDGTEKKIEACTKKYDLIKPVILKKNCGKGNAIKKGFEFAEGNLICFLDGDLEINPLSIKYFIDLIKNDNYDVVIGSKHHPLSNIKFPKHRTILSKSYQLFIKLLFNMPINDTQVGLKLFKRNVLEDILPRILCKKYAFDIELLVNINRRGYKITEAPIDLDLDIDGSNVDIQAFSLMFVDTCAIYYRASILNYYDNYDKNKEKIYKRFVSVMKYPYSFFKY